MDRQRGTVKWFSREKGWGFIRLESGDEIFVHHSDIEGEGFVNLEDDEPVEFTIEEMEKGPRARNVRSIGKDGAPAASGVAEAGEPSGSMKSAPAGNEPARGGSGGKKDSGRADRGSGGLRPLAEQLRERLGRHFPGLGG
jgi:CspA family cold shock protein